MRAEQPARIGRRIAGKSSSIEKTASYQENARHTWCFRHAIVRTTRGIGWLGGLFVEVRAFRSAILIFEN
jgi:hypothetical protein